VTSIESGTFINCNSLTSITIPGSVTSIGDDAFYDCKSLTSITIPGSVTSIGSKAFYRCSGLTSVYISDLETWCKITFTNEYSNPLFYAHHIILNGEEVTDLIIPSNVTTIGGYVFNCCSSLTSITIPNSVTSIGREAFKDCNTLTTIIIGNSVETIYTKAFANCPELTDVYCNVENVPSMLNGNTSCTDAFDGSNIENATLHVPMASIKAYKSTAPWSDFKTVVGPKPNVVTGIANILGYPVLIKSSNGQITVSGIDDGSLVTVYNLSGQKVGSATATAGTTQVSTTLSSGAVAIVKIGEKSVKVMIK
jgi:hypothetical protein